MVRRDGERGLIATAADITAFKRQQDHQQLLMRELNHRSKNLLTIVLSIVRQTGRVYPDPRAFMDRVQERLGSLARAHDVLAQQNWGGADLRAIVESQLLHQLQTYGERLSIKGEPCTLPPQAAHYVAMAIHELGSNAVKYGALAGEAGAVVVDWTLSPEGETTRLSLTWTETGAGGAATPTRQGFGSRILKTLAPGALDGEAMLEFGAAGFRWALTGRLQAGLGQPV
jgi:two-component sensor histidine kinase